LAGNQQQQPNNRKDNNIFYSIAAAELTGRLYFCATDLYSCCPFRLRGIKIEL
jgi:hypothetical protein